MDNVAADWNEQAALSAQYYLDYTAFSRQGPVDQLIYEGFTPEQAQYGVNQTGL
ncbi:Ltp family lipoprotein [Rhodococcus sp. H29-C3]|uniref:Ltp family lipoprotein n=1 Tax=Rhodococcus sp. H29-C3 TaxID=3046307 RepID=UPI0024BAE03F|nr:Ltp family lipoprotein [Rhodococcus sp. H29-C3]MDJ0361919.1 Ltp family lipoprotein [Rhodococcus sp. H29-C3]